MLEKKELEKYYIAKQLEQKEQVDFQHLISLEQIKRLAGVDLAYWKQEETEYAVCCIVVIDYRTKEIIEKQYCVDQIEVPYIPGCLAFREIPLFLKTKELLFTKPDLYVFDGNGYLHPRHMGLAVHAGILLGKITVGIAKTYYKICNVDFEMPENIAGAYSDIVINGEVYGRALRTHAGVKPVFVSTGNKISLDMAVHMANELTGKESHIPIPTRLADLMTHKERKKYNALD